MFLVRLLFTFSLLFSINVHAAGQLPGLEAGHYALVEGSPKLCAPYKLSELDLQSPKITVGGRYSLLLKNARKQVESDLDPSCEFVEQSTKEILNGETLISRTNSEVCGGAVVKSKISSKFVFRGPQVVLDHSIQEDVRQAAYRCVWNRIN